jgi:hypothetical protein
MPAEARLLIVAEPIRVRHKDPGGKEGSCKETSALGACGVVIKRLSCFLKMSHERKNPVFRSQACFMSVGRVWVIMGGLEKGEVFFGGLTCFQVRTGRSGKIKGVEGVLSVGGSFALSWNRSNAWRVWVFGIRGLEKMNSPSREGRGVFGLCREDLGFGLALVALGVKGGWVVDQDWGAVWVKTGISSLISCCPHQERLISIQFKTRVLLFVGKEEMFESV